MPSTWTDASNALCDPETALQSGPLQRFLTAEESRNTLVRPWKPFPDPSREEKNKYEAKVAPINIAPGNHAHYNLDQIREDALWLSQEAAISEYVALRLVVQEWQSRPVVQLLSGLTEEEAQSVQDAAGASILGGSIVVNAPKQNQQTDAQFDSPDQRRLRR